MFLSSMASQQAGHDEALYRTKGKELPAMAASAYIAHKCLITGTTACHYIQGLVTCPGVDEFSICLPSSPGSSAVHNLALMKIN